MLGRALPLALVLAALPAAAGPGGAPRPLPRTANGLRLRIAEEEARLAGILAEARTDPDQKRVDEYLRYSAAQMADSGKAVTLEVLFEIVSDAERSPQVREAAAEAIFCLKAIQNDPDLGLSGKGVRRPRAAFSMKVARMLTDDDDLHGRSLAKKILENLWPGISDADAVRYDPRKKPTWREGRLAWEKSLRR